MKNNDNFKDFLDGVANRYTWLIYNEEQIPIQSLQDQLNFFHHNFSMPLISVNLKHLIKWEHKLNSIHPHFVHLDQKDQRLYALIYLAHHYGGFFLPLNFVHKNVPTYFDYIENNVYLAAIFLSNKDTIQEILSRLNSTEKFFDCAWMIRRKTEFTKICLDQIHALMNSQQLKSKGLKKQSLLHSCILESINVYIQDILFVFE